MENRKLGGHLGFLPMKGGCTPNLVENFFELKKDDITIPKMYDLLWIKFIPASRLALRHYKGLASFHKTRTEDIPKRQY